MASQSSIEWTDATWNPVRARYRAGNGEVRTGWHCVHVSEGCRNCYAEAMNLRLGTKLAFKPGNLHALDIFLDEKLLTDPLRWKRPRSVFLSSMTDVFADFVSDEMLDRLFAVMALSPQHFFRVLTKRPERMRDYVNSEKRGGKVEAEVAGIIDLMDAKWIGSPGWRAAIDASPRWPLPNVGLGVSVEDQATADERIPHLLATPAAMRFVSAEPLLGAVDLRRVRRFPIAPREFFDALRGSCWTDQDNVPNADPSWDWPGIALDPSTKLDEVIVGGESGKGARPMHPHWARSLRDQCADAGVSFFFKQWGEWAPHRADLEDEHGSVRTTPKGGVNWSSVTGGPFGVFRVGKKAAGALLDGREHREVAPQVTAHFERLAPHPKNPMDFSTSPQGGGDGEGEAG